MDTACFKAITNIIIVVKAPVLGAAKLLYMSCLALHESLPNVRVTISQAETEIMALTLTCNIWKRSTCEFGFPCAAEHRLE